MPCINELVVKIAKDQTVEQMPLFNTVRLDCNAQTLGVFEREFRFHDIAMSQVESGEALDLPKMGYFMENAISLFKTIVFGGPEDSEEDPIFFKDFNEAAMFQIAEVIIESRKSPWN